MGKPGGRRWRSSFHRRPLAAVIQGPQRGHHGGMWRRAERQAVACRQTTRPPAAAPPRPRICGRARRDARRQRRSAAPGRNSRQEPGECGPRTSQQNFLFCWGPGALLCATAPLPGRSTKRLILLIWLVGPAPPGGAIHPPGARGPRPPLWWAPAVALWGGTTTPPHGCFVLCANRKSSKKIRHGGRHGDFFRVCPSNNCKNPVFGGLTPPLALGEKKVDLPLTSW